MTERPGARRPLPPPTVKAAPRTQAQRRLETRERLLSATIHVLLERGYNGLTTKEVAAQSGLSNGALVYYFESKAELVVAATAAVYDEFLERTRRLAHTDEAFQHPVRHYMESAKSVYFEWPFTAAFEVLVVARTDPALMNRIRPVLEHFWRERDLLWLQVFVRAGYTPDVAHLAMELTLNVVRGLGVHGLWNSRPVEQDLLLQQWLAVAERQFPRPVAAAKRVRKTTT